MNNIAIIVDSTASIKQEDVLDDHIYIAHHSVSYKNKDYIDQITITGDEIQDILMRDEDVKTSQPSLGRIIDLIKEVKSKNYDHIFIISLTSELSGTYNAFKHAIADVGLANYSLIDTKTVAGPLQESLSVILKLNQSGHSPDEINNYLENVYFKDTESFLYPDNLKQLSKSGRITPAAVKLASLLKIKVLLKLENQGKSIDRFAIARTENRLLRTLIKDLKEAGLDAKKHIMYYPQLQAMDKVKQVHQAIEAEFGPMDYKIINLPAALAVHAGLGTTAIQWCIKA